MRNLFLPSVCRKCEMEIIWQLFSDKNGGRTHTLEYNERTIPYVFVCNCVLYFVAAP